jgi:cupin fold WbuC family metalloprotein
MRLNPIRRRKHKNLHADYQEACQRFFNAIEPDSYLRPHCHGPYQGRNLDCHQGFAGFHGVWKQREVQAVHLFGAGNHAEEPDVAVGVEVQPGQWHTVISLESGSILLEMKGAL